MASIDFRNHRYFIDRSMAVVAKMDRRGFYEWIVQRISAVLMAVYAIFLLSYFLSHQPLNYAVWHALFSSVAMKMMTLIVVVSMLWHAWIGLWTVLTDYVKQCMVRLLLQVFILITLFSCLVWCVMTLFQI